MQKKSNNKVPVDRIVTIGTRTIILHELEDNSLFGDD